jgi:glucosamine-6-phosphate deaminase
MAHGARVSAHTSLVVVSDRVTVGSLASELIVNRLAARSVRLLLPTGHTPLPMYEGLRQRARQGRVAPSRAEVFQLDEYAGLPPDDPMSYRAYLERELDGSGLVLADRFHADAGDLRAEADRYQGVLDGVAIDVAVLGIGPDGHVAFNGPGSLPLSEARVVRLGDSTRRAAAADFGALEHVPTHALTVGIRTLLEARELLLLVTGAVKAEILREALAGVPRAEVPASLLRLHPRLTVICDRAAAARLTPRPAWASDRALVVLGHRDPRSRRHRASHQSFARLAVAARIAQHTPARAVVITGFTSTGGLSEAEQMAEEWNVTDVPTLAEVAGRDTIENATRSLPLVLALGGVRRVTVVTSAWHLRARGAFARYRKLGLHVDFRYDWSEGPWLRMLVNELRLMRRARRLRSSSGRRSGTGRRTTSRLR